jgi:hypothetical protein
MFFFVIAGLHFSCSSWTFHRGILSVCNIWLLHSAVAGDKQITINQHSKAQHICIIDFGEAAKSYFAEIIEFILRKKFLVLKQGFI